MEYNVYIDVLFFVNLMINTAILISCAAILKIKYSSARLLSSAALGAVYACIVFFPGLRLIYTFAMRAIFAGVMCFVAYGPKSLMCCVKQAAVLFATTVAFALVALALLYFTDIGIRLGGVISNGVFYFNIPMKFLLLSCAISYAAIALLQKFLKKSAARSFENITLVKNGKSVNLKVLLDTGNLLRDPMSGNFVMIADEKSVAPLFDFSVSKTLNFEDFSSLPKGFRLIPFSSVGKKNGLLAAFVPDSVIIGGEPHQGIITAICGEVSFGGDYDALISPEAVEISSKNVGFGAAKEDFNDFV